MVEEKENRRPVIFRDIRRYYCEYCGIGRSKKSLISWHILSHHQVFQSFHCCILWIYEYTKETNMYMVSSLFPFFGILILEKVLMGFFIVNVNQEELKQKEEENEQAKDEPKVNICEQCGVSFKKPAYLRQHMQSHSLEVIILAFLRFVLFFC